MLETIKNNAYTIASGFIGSLLCAVFVKKF
jgi:hypothetical protein